MIAGLPGTGIGGLFYLLIAFWMPFRELYLTLRKRPRPARSTLVRRQSFITLALVLATWATGELLGLFLHRLGVIATNNVLHRNVLYRVPVLLTLAVLLTVYLTVHLLRISVRHPVKANPRPRADAASSFSL